MTDKALPKTPEERRDVVVLVIGELIALASTSEDFGRQHTLEGAVSQLATAFDVEHPHIDVLIRRVDFRNRRYSGKA